MAKVQPPPAAVEFGGPGYGAIVPRKLAELIPYANNPRIHDVEQIELLKRSMREFGFTDPILVDETGEIIGGHGRLRAAQALGIAEVPTQVVTGWTEAKKRAYRILENKAVERGEWDWRLVADEIKELSADDFDLELTGFETFELDPLLGSEWKDPEEAKPAEKADKKEHGATDGRTIKITIEQYNTVKLAMDQVRARQGDAEMSEGRALEIICAEWKR